MVPFLSWGESKLSSHGIWWGLASGAVHLQPLSPCHTNRQSSLLLTETHPSEAHITQMKFCSTEQVSCLWHHCLRACKNLLEYGKAFKNVSTNNFLSVTTVTYLLKAYVSRYKFKSSTGNMYSVDSWNSRQLPHLLAHQFGPQPAPASQDTPGHCWQGSFTGNVCVHPDSHQPAEPPGTFYTEALSIGDYFFKFGRENHFI